MGRSDTLTSRDTSLVSFRYGDDIAAESDDEQALALLAEADGVSKQEATVRAIHEAASRRLRQDKIRTLSAGARERYADLLTRLGQ